MEGFEEHPDETAAALQSQDVQLGFAEWFLVLSAIVGGALIIGALQRAKTWILDRLFGKEESLERRRKSTDQIRREVEDEREQQDMRDDISDIKELCRRLVACEEKQTILIEQGKESDKVILGKLDTIQSQRTG